MSQPGFPTIMGAPVAPDPTTYLTFGDRLIPWEYDGWDVESLSWKTGCYIHSGLSNYQLHFEGADALDFFKSIATNSFEKFSIGAMKHAVMCTDDGLIAQHAILQRNGETLFKLFAAGLPWATYLASRSGLDVKVEPVGAFLHQVAGPTSLATLERAAGESLSDIAFLRFRMASIAGHRVEIARIGMSGNLAYEVRGPIEQGPDVYNAILAAGRDFNIRRLGWRTYFVNHVEGGFPQTGWTFFNASIMDADFRALVGKRGEPRLTGSVDPANLRARLRTPAEVGWEHTVRLDHDFKGRAAIEAELADPRRTIVTLRWEPEDVLDIHASLMQPGEPYKIIDMPTTPSWQHGFFAHADHVLRDGKPVGYSSGTIYSYYFREMLSVATIDRDCAEIGTDVVVQWGDHGKRIKNVRARVERYPYLSEGRNDQVDAGTLGSAGQG